MARWKATCIIGPASSHRVFNTRGEAAAWVEGQFKRGARHCVIERIRGG